MYNSQYYACGNGTYTDSADCFYTGYPRTVFGVPTTGIGSPGALPFMDLGVVGLANAQVDLGPYVSIGQNSSLRHDAKSTFVINTTEIELGSDLLLKNIFMYNRSWSDEKNDYDGGPFPLISVQGNLTPDLTTQTDEGRFYNRAKQFSEELQLQGKAFDGRLDFTLGLYYINQKNRFDSEVKFFDFYPIGPFVPIHYIQDTNTESWAVFAQGTYALTDRLNFTGGFRWTSTETIAKQLPGSDWYGCDPAVCMPGFSPEDLAVSPEYRERLKVSKPSWTVSLDYQATPDLLIYVTQRGSWRSGSFNYSLAPVPLDTSLGGNQFKPEKTYDIEAGLKYNGQGLGFPATFNLAVFNQWIKDIQRGANLISPVTGTSILTTIAVPEAQITGVEADVSLKPTDWLSLGGSLSYTDARFTKNEVTVPGNPPLVYGPYADAPKWSGTVFGEVSHDLGPETGILSLRGDLYFQSKSYFANLGDLIPGSDIASYQLVGARLSWEDVLGGPVSLSLYGRNLTNEKYYTGGNPTGLSAGFMTAFPGFPRTYGVEAKVVFGGS
jgi:iron complex outermembrane receptor protein